MFEKEAIRHAFEYTTGVECLIKPVEDFTYEELDDEQQEKAYDFQKGAEFGYNKAEENGTLKTQVSILQGENKGLKELVKGYENTRDRMIAMGFPTFKSVKEYSAKLKELEKENAELKRGYHYEAEVVNGKPTGKAILVPDNIAYAKSIIKDLLDNSDEYAKQRAREFLEVK